MPYPNDNSRNIVLMQTSASADGSGKFPFTERIISGSNLFILTDANGNLTGSTSIPGGSFTNLTVTGALTASIISASNSITAAAATFVGPVTMSSTLSASGGIITSTISASSNVYVSGSLTVIGNIIGTIDSASVVSIAPINDGSTYYVTFVDSISGSRQLKTDADILSYTPSTNILAVGTSASGSITVGAKVTMQDLGGTSQLRVGINTTDTASLLVSSNAFQVIKGQGPGVDKVFTNLELSASNNVLFSNTTQATDWNNGALNVVGGVGIGKNLYVSGSTFLYGDLTIFGTGSIVNISSSTVIIGDNRIQLNAGVPIQRYAGIDVFDSGSGTITNNVTSSLLWDGLNDYWVLVSANSSSGAPLTQSSAIMIGGPTGSFGGESLLTVNYIPKVQSSGRNLQNSLLSDNGTTLSYAGTGISASQVTSSQLTVQYTGSITYATGVYITYTTGSFTTITITTGSSPGLGAQVPSTPTASGLAGQINVDNNFIYVYTNQVWKRVPLSTWTA